MKNVQLKGFFLTYTRICRQTTLKATNQVAQSLANVHFAGMYAAALL